MNYKYVNNLKQIAMVWKKVSVSRDDSEQPLAAGPALSCSKSRKAKREGRPRNFGFEELEQPTIYDNYVEIRQSELGGMGLFAKKFFVEGQRMFGESPFLSIVGITEMKGNPHNEWETTRSPLSQNCEASAMISDAVKNLNADDSDIFWSFSQVHVYGSEKNAAGVFHTNYIDVTDLRGREIGCMYRFISRINHSCQPNVRWVYDAPNHQLLVVAQRDLNPGEELLVDYCGHADNWKGSERRDHLSLFYGFDCCCPICVVCPLGGKADMKSGSCEGERTQSLSEGTTSQI